MPASVPPLHFLSDQVLLAGGPRRLLRQLDRLLLHLGFSDVRVIDGSGDGGGDILAVRERTLFVFQVKWSSSVYFDTQAVDQAENAKALYAADRAVVFSNAIPSPAAERRIRELASVGVGVEVWGRSHLEALYPAIPTVAPSTPKLRKYQQDAADALCKDLARRNRGLLILATGLGKTVVAGEVIRRHFQAYPTTSVLVVAHLRELVAQLEKALWRHLPKEVMTQILTGEERPAQLDGLTCATVQSALGAVAQGYRPTLVMMDETHHLGEAGDFRRLLEDLSDAHQFGVTATPWRGDQFDITTHFGDPSFTMGIAQGMAQGFLAQVDYRLMIDDIDWDVVREQSELGYTVAELNSRLFLPQRDEAIIENVLSAWRTVRNPRAILFCQSIEHGEQIARLLSQNAPELGRVGCLHSQISTRDRDVLLTNFRLGRTPVLTAVDILNEGVDVPDVNIVCFLRVTHSRRIFVQQLGRGLRLTGTKNRVLVLDFVTDLRRVAAALDLKRSLGGLGGLDDTETLLLSGKSSVEFSNAAVGSLMDAWIRDAASLETAMDDARLQFPETDGIG